MKTSWFIVLQFYLINLSGQQINYNNLKGHWIADSIYVEVDSLLVYGEEYAIYMDSIIKAQTTRVFGDCMEFNIRKRNLLICFSDRKTTKFRLSIFDDSLWWAYSDYVLTFDAKFLTTNDLLLSEWFPLGRGYIIAKRRSKNSS